MRLALSLQTAVGSRRFPPLDIVTCIVLQALTAPVITAGTLAGDKWIEPGLMAGVRSIQTQMLGEAELESDIAVSRDGTLVAYTLTSADVESNVNVTTLWVMKKGSLQGAKQVGAAVRGPSLWTSFEPHFSPSGRELAYVVDQAVVVEHLDGTKGQFIKLDTESERMLGPGLVATSVRSLSWSPSGKQLGMIVSARKTTEARSGLELSATDRYSRDPNLAPARLVVYDLPTTKWITVSPESTDVDTLDWSPDGQRVAFAGSVNYPNPLSDMYNDLYIADLRTGGIERVSLAAGLNRGPLWSPDGRWIAFESEGGQVRYLAQGRVGLYDLKKKALSYPAFDEIGDLAGFAAVPLCWAPDSRSLLLRVPYHLSKQIFTLSVPEGRLHRFTRDDSRNFYDARYDLSGQNVLYLSESFLEPPNVYSSPAHGFQPQKLTNFKSDPAFLDVQARQVAWQSRDGHWTIHGWLLLPHVSGGERSPLLVFADGGPHMISPAFRTGWQIPLHAFLANGVAVLIPNSRGRGGYGSDFMTTWEKERNPGQGPLEDDLDGVDYVIKAGIADPNRIGLAGLSWGGYLAAYALTHTDRFKAIIVNEAVSLNMVEDGFTIAGNPAYIEFARQLGKGVPFDDDDVERLRRLSPVYQVASAKTPALLEFGANSLIRDGYSLFQGLKHFGVPSELISYPRSGHGTTEPALLYDETKRDLEWFAYWVLGKPTAHMLDRYGPPRIAEWVN